MEYLEIAQYMAAAVFLTIAATHFLVWLRVRDETIHLVFSLTAAAAGANALAEAMMYRADSIDSMSAAVRWYVATSGCWAIATVCYFAFYARVGRVGRYLGIAIVIVCAAALIINLFSPASFLFNEITDLREIELPWGERFRLPIGENNPLRVLTDIAFLAILGVVADGCYQIWCRGDTFRACLFGSTVFTFMACFFVHAFLVDMRVLESPYLSTYGFLALVALMSYGLAGEVMKQRDLEFRLHQKENELKTVVTEERDRIAADLHDSVTQTLFSTAAIADALPEVWRRNPEQGRNGLQDLKHLTRAALAEMRTLLLELHPSSLVEKDLGTLLHQLVDATSGRTRLSTKVDIQCGPRFPEDVQITLYRCAQEALNNVVKHSEASQVWLCLEENAEGIELTVRDDGRGFDPSDDPSGMGLGMMRQRVDSINGQLHVESEVCGGTTIRVHWSAASGNNGDHEA